MKVLLLNDLCDPRIGSSIRQMYQEAERLRELGHEAMVVSTTQDPSEVGESEILGTPVLRLLSNVSARFRAWGALSNQEVRKPFRKLLSEWKPDIVHSQLLHSQLSYGALTDARNAGAGVVFTAHDVMTFCYQKLTCFHGGEEHGGELRDYTARASKCIPCQRFRFRPGRNRAIRRILERDVDRFTVVSDELGRAISANGIRVDSTVHNAIREQDELPTEADLQAFRERFDLVGKQVLAIGGRLHEQKGVVQLFRMLKELRVEFPALRLLVMGHRKVYDSEFAALSKSIGVDDLVVPTDWLNGAELQCAYAATDVFVTPSICFDTFGLVNLEAMEHSKPVVATVFGGSQEVVEDGITGWIENPLNPEAYAEKIADLLRDPERAKRMGAAGYLRLREHFTIERLTDEYLREYDLALQARPN
ncbi:MAG: glycosyltransferase involved in cell wall biosynthesis [Planctomycetota bacterium]